MFKVISRSIFRNLLKDRYFTLIKIFGLTIGFAGCIMSFMYVKHELSFDRFNTNADNIYRIVVDGMIGNTEVRQTYTCPPLPAQLLATYPEIRSVCRLNNNHYKVKIGEKTFLEENQLQADSTFFNIFSIPLITGDADKVLAEPFTMVVSESFAHKYFSDKDPVNETVILDDRLNFRITGVMKDIPKNSHFSSDFLLSMGSFEFSKTDQWWNNTYRTYLLLEPNSDYKLLESKLPEFVAKHLFDNTEDYGKWTKSGNRWTYYLQPLTDIHLNSDLWGELSANGNKTYVQMFFLIGIFIIIIAAVNYMNLTTARSGNRANEIGIKKVNGAGKRPIMIQFLSESVIVSLISFVLSLVLIRFTLPYFNSLMDASLDLNLSHNLLLFVVLLLSAVLVGIISGSYPAFFLSSFKPIKVLKGNHHWGNKNINLRNALVVFQFAISVTLIVGSIMIYKQFTYIKDKKLGFNKEQVVVVENTWLLNGENETIRQELLESPYIGAVGFSSTIPGRFHNNWGMGAEGVDDWFTLNICACDEDFLEVMGLEMSEGRFFSDTIASDNAAIIINEAAAKLFDWEDGPVGKRFSNRYTAIGVIKDYHYESKHQKIRPMALLKLGEVSRMSAGVVSIRLKPGQYEQAINHIRKVWRKHADGCELNYAFLNDDYDAMYKNEQQISRLFLVFAILAIFIACLGLIGLSSFMIEKRFKEIGIRKVNGAKIREILTMLNIDFIKWVSIAYIIACPLAWYFLHTWLQHFTYRATMSWWIFGVAGLASLGIALFTVSWQSWWAAGRNPVEALRYE